MLGLLRKNYGARIDGFRGIQRQDIQLEVDVKDSKIALKHQKGWSKTVWEPMTVEVHTALLYAVKGIVVERTVQILPTGGIVKREFAFVLPPVSKPLEYIFQASKSGRKDQKDSTMPNKPMSQQACQKMIRRVRVIMAEKLGNDGYIDIVSHSERASLAYWLAKDPDVAEAGKLRALRMKSPATLQLYSAKGFSRHELPRIWNKFAAGGVAKFLHQQVIKRPSAIK